MRNIDLYRGGSRGLLGGQVARIPSYTAKPYDIETPASARYGFAAKMVEALTAKAQENKEKEDMAAYMAARSTKFDPSAITPLAEDSPYLSVQRENMAQALAGTPQSPLGGSADNVFEPQERSVDGMQPSSLGVSADDVFLPATGVEPFRLIDPSQGEEGAALDAGQRALSSNPAMQAALLGAVDGDVGTRAEDEAAYMAEQYRNRITPRQAVQNLTPQTKAGRDAQYAYELSRIDKDETAQLLREDRAHQIALKKAGLDTGPDLKAEYMVDDQGNTILSPKGIHRQEEKWRTRLQPSVDNLQEIDRKISILNEALDLKNGTADIAAVNTYQRMIDDGVVRSEDVKMQGEATSLYQQLNLFVEKRKSGDLLPQPVRDKMRSMANKLANKTVGGLKTQIEAWQTVVDDTHGLQWKRVFPPTLNEFLVPRKFGTGDGNGNGAGKSSRPNPSNYTGTDAQWDALSKKDQDLYL
tara:strand:- start:433 stop:1842 length:1410 start_codon:yes stop_codon:yes gene_type:complete